MWKRRGSRSVGHHTVSGHLHSTEFKGAKSDSWHTYDRDNNQPCFGVSCNLAKFITAVVAAICVVAGLPEGAVTGGEEHLLDLLNSISTQDQLELCPTVHCDAPGTHIGVGIGGPGGKKEALTLHRGTNTHSSRSSTRTRVSRIPPFFPGRTSAISFPVMATIALGI